ncbi:MAG: intein-containing RctB family protein [bacterium]
MELERIHDYAWRIRKHGNMRVDGIVYASRKLLDDIRGDESLEQVMNVACLPGIVGASLAMPDIHWGYGFCIGGVAAFDADEGVISPGGVGYDINCLPANADIMDHCGYRRSIESYKSLHQPVNIRCLANGSEVKSAAVVRFLERKSDGTLIRLTTESGKVILATRDHPILTPDGMVPIGNMGEGDEAAIYHFEGVKYEKPSNDILVDEKNIIELSNQIGKGSSGSAVQQIMKFFKKIDLLPLRYDSWQLPYLIKIIGYLFGDGTLYVDSTRNRYRAAFYGKREDLESIRQDIQAIGFSPSIIYSRDRRHQIETMYNICCFDRREDYFYVGSASFGLIMTALGVPVGKKVATAYEVPLWIRSAPLWQKRLFLASLFGAELSTPKTIKGHGHNFLCPVLDMNKQEDLLENGRQFLVQLSKMLSEFGVKTQKISSRYEHIGKTRKRSCRLRLIMSSRYESIINLYARVGFEYNRLRQARAALASAYLKAKEKHLDWREQVSDNIRAYYKMTGTDARSVHDYFGNWAPNFSFVVRSMHGRNSRVRVAEGFTTFEEFVEHSTVRLGSSGCVWETVIAVDEEPYDGPVYDFTVDHPDHNFIADGFVVSNCGVRLLRTELLARDMAPKIREIVNQLFRDIPTGIGSHHKNFRLGPDDLKQVLKEGAGWAVKRGYGDENDLDHIEAHGCISGADPQAVSEHAKGRGRDQLGTLGSGNHFVEVQEVSEIYDEQAANVMGLFPGQLVVMVHTGSRGLGHQVCEDHIEIMLAASRKYHIELPDKQLCCAPIGSPQGQHYFAAMAAAANFAFANRQMITHWVREALMHALRMGPADIRISPVYDVCHNIAKFEEHMVGGVSRRLCMHRKGATRAFPAKHPEVPAVYRSIGQPVLIPGDMGRYSFVLVGTDRAMEETFGSTCHGAGRLMSRHQAKRICRGRDIERELLDKGIIVRGASRATVVEEVPEAYKDVADVVDAVVGAGISKKVAKLRPLGVIKG